MDNSDFSQSFMQSVKADTQAQPGASDVSGNKSSKRKFVIFAIAFLIIIVGVVVGVVMLVPKPKTEEIAKETVGFQMTCEGNDVKYEFYKDQSYKILNETTNAEVESGRYEIDGGLIVMKGGAEAREAAYLNGKLADNEKSYSCVEPATTQGGEN